MKILHVRLDAPNYSSDSIEKGFTDNGFKYLGLRWQELRFNLGTEGMRKYVIDTARNYEPDYIFCHVQNIDAFSLENYIELNSIGKVINFTFDVRSKEKTQWLYGIAKNIHYTFFSCYEDVLNCRELEINNTGNILPSCDMDVYRKYPAQKTEEGKIVFIGSNFITTNLNFDMSKERVYMVEMIENNYEGRFALEGLNWNKSTLANQQTEVNLYNTSAIGLSQNNFDRIDYTSDRLFRIMASGCFCLTKYFTGIQTHFNRGEHLDWWRTLGELKQKIDYYTIHKEEREAIAKTGSLFVRENHTWTNRVVEMFKIINNA